MEAGRLRVEDARGAAPSIPFWRGEAPGRTRELSDEISAIRERVVALDDPAAAREFLEDECRLDRAGAEQAVAYIRAGVAGLGALPSVRAVVAERFFDEGGGMQLVIHAPFGVRINRAWGLALRKRFCRSFNFELQAAATDNGIVISLAEQHSFPLEIIFRFLNTDTVEDVLTQAMLPAPMFSARWRWNATRSLALLRFAGGRKVPPPILRMRSDDLLASVFPDQVACQENLVGDIRVPDHPLVAETVRDCLHEAMDLDGLKRLLQAIDDGSVATKAVDTAEPSVFSHEILNANPYAFLDDAPLEERRARAVQLRRTLPADAGAIGALDPAAIDEVVAESWPLVRDADELHDALLTLIALPATEDWRHWYDTLAAERRAATLVVGGQAVWVTAERARLAMTIYPDGVWDHDLPDVPQRVVEGREAAVAELLRGWLESSGPQMASRLASRLALSRIAVDSGLARLEGEGQVLRGRFSPAGCAPDAEGEWCNRRVLARIHRLTLGRLRREIEPVTSADLVRFLARWQHVAPGTELHGTSGLLQIVKQLQGYEISAAAWERDVLARRIARYDPEMLDQLCLSGDIMWGRVSPHPAFDLETPPSATRAARPARLPRRVRPTRVAPVALLLREDAGWLLPAAAIDVPTPDALSHAAREVLDQLHARGASFLRDLVRATGRLPTEVEDGLWELTAAGIVTADSFDNLRALIDPKRRRGEGRFRAARPRHSAGRWAVLRSPGETPVEPAGPVGSAAAGGFAESFARQLLLRWGVVFRDLIARETIAPPWRELLAALRRLEARGEIRGGRFVAGFLGEQFARPEAIALLRIVRRERVDAPPLRVAAADPLNLVGIVTPGVACQRSVGGCRRRRGAISGR